MNIELIDRLKSLGFKEYEAKVFLVLLKGSSMSASEIAKEAKIIRNSIYDVLKSFVEKGYCNEIETNSILKYELINPEVILDKIEGSINSKRNKDITSLKDTFTQLIPLYKTNVKDKDSNINIELIRGYNQHREAKFIELMNKAKKEIHYMIKLEHYISDEVDENAKKFFKRGGIIRSVYEAGNDIKIKRGNKWQQGTLKDLIKIVEKYESIGELLRLSKLPVPNMTIFDREIVFFNINDKTVPRHNEADIIIRNKEFAQNMILVFESYWEKSLTIKEFNKTEL
jgi:sugar-specific transcriptional regulator TrmB